MLGEDPALLAAFLDESRESLDGLESRLIELDSAPDLRAEVDAVFRPVHTLKGNAPFFGLMEIQRLAHALETVLDHLRKGRLNRSQAITDALLAGLDGLRGCIERIAAGQPEVADPAVFAALVDRLIAVADDTTANDPWAKVFADLAEIERHEDQFDPATVAQIARLRHSLTALRSAPPKAQTPNTTSIRTDPVGALRQRLAKSVTTPLDDQAAAAVLAGLREVKAGITDAAHATLIDQTLAKAQASISGSGFDDEIRRRILDCLDQVGQAPTALEGPLQPRTNEPVSERRTRPDSESHGKSMRVSEAAVDGFLAHVGELLVIGDQLEHLQRRLTASEAELGLARDMRQAVASFSALSTELQRSIMAVRRVPVRALFQKAPRLVRDIAQATGKDIAVVLNGEMEEVDKGRLDLLDGPLTHLVRNCADHGVELPAARLAVGKPGRGTITLTAGSDDGWFTLEISDDGKGLNLEAIRRKGESLGLLQPGAVLDEPAIIDLIFASGLSTADKITGVSGRGVGMDVVKRQIEQAGGSISVATKAGQGTVFRLRLPSAVSTQIIPAFLVRDGGGIFALPLDLVRESFVDPKAEVTNGTGVVIRHGSVLPVAPLGRVLGQATAVTDQRRTFVTVAWNKTTVAVSVDETMGVHRLVIRPLSGIAKGDLDGRFQGAALLGDGALALVVDPDRLLELIGCVAPGG